MCVLNIYTYNPMVCFVLIRCLVVCAWESSEINCSNEVQEIQTKQMPQNTLMDFIRVVNIASAME